MEAGWSTSVMSGFKNEGSDFDPIDMRNWAHYAWIRGMEVHDLSLPRRFLRGEIWGPFGFYMGNEDITGTGTDIVPLFTGGAFQPSGITATAHQPSPPWADAVGWMVADKRNHGSGLAINPYTSLSTYHDQDVVLDVIEKAVQNRAAQLASPPPNPPFQHLPRGTGESMRGIDDPQEWAHGRLGQAMPPPATQPPGLLVRDDGFFNQVQPGAAGTWLASKGAAIIMDQRLFIGEAGGVVSRFRIDWAHPQQPLVREACSQPLGHQAWSLVSVSSGSSWQLVVGTRRHLHKLDPTTLTVLSSFLLPWERGMPYHLRSMNLLPGSPGNEIVYASVHGGLCVHDSNLNFLLELPEPGIKNFAPAGSGVALLSERGVVASVAFANNGSASLTASSVLQNGLPLDMVSANLNLPVVGQSPALVTLYSGDEHGLSLRVFSPGDLSQVATVQHLQTMMPPGGAPPAGGAGVGLGGQAQVLTARFVDPNGEQGDHVLVLFNDELLLLNQFAQVVAAKRLYSVDPAATPTLYTPGLKVCAVAVGDMGSPQTFDYLDQIVVCGLSGQLSWLHVQDMLTPGFNLPSSYTMVTTTQNAVQPRASQSMSATWAIGRRPDDDLLHLLDQTGNYWQVDYYGNRTLVRREYLAAVASARGWQFVGGIGGAAFNLPSSEVQVPMSAAVGSIQTYPWCPIKNLAVVFEQQPGQYRVPNNWHRFPNPTTNVPPSFLPFLDGFVVFACGGSARPAATPGDFDVFWWSGIPQAWPNLVEGMQLQTGLVSSIWASTGQPTSMQGVFGDLTPYHDLRNEIAIVPYMNLQAIKTAQLNGQNYLVLACPGGRVRVLMPGAMRTGQPPHGLGNLPIPLADTSDDFGQGSCALAVREDATNTLLDVFVGTFYGHPPRVNYPNTALADGEVLAGMVRHVQWSPANGFRATNRTYDLHPTTQDPRGGFGVVGLLVDDLISSNPGDELVVTTIEGDLFVFSVNTGAPLYRTWVAGALGFYNSIVAADLNHNGKKELYLAGSYGLYRFVDPNEPPAENP